MIEEQRGAKALGRRKKQGKEAKRQNIDKLTAMFSVSVCVCVLGCFSKDTLKKNKMFTPARYWGAPRKSISRRRD